MDLSYALRLEPGRRAVVAFVGGGGKSSALFRLGHELAAQGRRVVMTTTTRIFESQVRLSPAWLPAGELQRLDEFLANGRPVLVTGRGDGHGKALGLDPALVDQLAARPDVDALLIEADGSRMRPFKAPAEHEPVVPQSTTHLVPVVGVDVLGKPLDDRYVHRAARVAALAGVPPGTPVTPELIATVLAHPDGGLKGRPAGARVVPLVNKADLDPGGAESIACALLRWAAIDEIVVGAAGSAATAFRVYGRTAGIILAAGQSSRFGRTKQLMPWDNRPLAAHVAETALAAGLEPVLVVVGHEAERVGAAVRDLPVTIVPNPAYAQGQSTSMRAGLQALVEQTEGSKAANAALFLLADQPLITTDIIATLREAHRASLAPIVLPHYRGQRGNPVLFDRSLWPELLAVSGDTGGRALFERYRDRITRIEFETAAVVEDIDTLDEYEALREERRGDR